MHVESEAAAAALVPPSMSARLEGYEWERNQVGESGAAIYRLHGKPAAADLFLKHGRGAVADDVAEEAARLRWLGGHIPVPAVEDFVQAPGEAWLLMAGLPGETAYRALEARLQDRTAVVDALAQFLLRLHAIPIGDCPFDSGHVGRLEAARIRIDAGLVDEEDFDDERQGWSAEQVWQAMYQLLPFAPDPVVTHGDFSLDNILMIGGEVNGCINAGRVGVADRYQDLAIAWNCLGEFGAALQERFLARYGVRAPDARKLRFHLLLDELF